MSTSIVTMKRLKGVDWAKEIRRYPVEWGRTGKEPIKSSWSLIRLFYRAKWWWARLGKKEARREAQEVRQDMVDEGLGEEFATMFDNGQEDENTPENSHDGPDIQEVSEIASGMLT
ncbi:uncharacterized protein PAC_07247 [Phialocephala subalpina]|uniref:Uncharacterized protein n=1 Tax=Phialocephala subalpina TaxID=576137 RepID=A0A1L7WX72_9HELO|nr:uncharacterized protein PAC_07247 [Phialocephala subalpina]